MEKFGGEIGKKYAGINHSGRKALDSREVSEFNSVPEQLKKRFNLSVSLKDSSEETLRTMVLDEVIKIGDQLGIKLFLAGRDFPIHISILEGLFTPGTQEDEEINKRQEEIFNELKYNKELQDKLSNILAGKTIEFKYLLIDKGNIILTSTDIPEFILEARKLLSDRYSEADLKPLAMNNILHMTISRVSGLPENKDLLLQYKEELVKLRHSVSAHPLQLTIGSVSSQSSYDLLTKND